MRFPARSLWHNSLREGRTVSKLRVLVLDDGSVDALFDPGSVFVQDGLEVVGTVRIAPPLAAAMGVSPPGAEVSGGTADGHPVLRETTGAAADPCATRCRGAQDGGETDPTRTGPGLPDAAVYLTRTELDVLRLLVKGMRNKDIAQELYISVNTVKSHVTSIFRKLRVKNRSQAVRYVYGGRVR